MNREQFLLFPLCFLELPLPSNFPHGVPGCVYCIEYDLWLSLCHVIGGDKNQRQTAAFLVIHRIAAAWVILVPNPTFFFLDVNRVWNGNHLACETLCGLIGV